MNELPRETPARNHEFFCLASLLALLLVLLQRGLGFSCLLPFLIGLGGISGRWRMAAPFLLGVLIVLLSGIFDPWNTFQEEDDLLSDLLLAAAVLGYVAGQLRLRALTAGWFPVDPRLPKNEPRRLSIHGADSGREIAWLALSLPAWVIVASFTREQLPDYGFGLGISPRGWRLVVLTWLLGCGAIVVVGLVAYVNRKARTAMEAAVFLQDLLWRETRGEQRRLYRWRAWSRQRLQRRKERS